MNGANSQAKDRPRTWREVARELQRLGRRKPITLPRLAFLERADEREDEKRVA